MKMRSFNKIAISSAVIAGLITPAYAFAAELPTAPEVTNTSSNINSDASSTSVTTQPMKVIKVKATKKRAAKKSAMKKASKKTAAKKATKKRVRRSIVRK